MSEPLYTISVDRGSMSWAVFENDFQIVKDFTRYVSEQTALHEAKTWCGKRSITEPKVVYPRITKLKIS